VDEVGHSSVAQPGTADDATGDHATAARAHAELLASLRVARANIDRNGSANSLIGSARGVMPSSARTHPSAYDALTGDTIEAMQVGLALADRDPRDREPAEETRAPAYFATVTPTYVPQVVVPSYAAAPRDAQASSVPAPREPVEPSRTPTTPLPPMAPPAPVASARPARGMFEPGPGSDGPAQPTAWVPDAPNGFEGRGWTVLDGDPIDVEDDLGSVLDAEPPQSDVDVLDGAWPTSPAAPVWAPPAVRPAPPAAAPPDGPAAAFVADEGNPTVVVRQPAAEDGPAGDTPLRGIRRPVVDRGRRISTVVSPSRTRGRSPTCAPSPSPRR
jgi:hypothetical protein